MRKGFHLHADNLVLHQFVDDSAYPGSARIGFIVAKRFVKHATARNLVKRRLRHLVRARLGQFPEGSLNVFYTKAGVDTLDFPALSAQVDLVLGKAKRKRERALPQ